MQPSANDDKKKRSSGYWRATEKGQQFAKGEIEIPKYVFTLDNKVVGYSKDQINIYDALSKKFNYQELFK